MDLMNHKPHTILIMNNSPITEIETTKKSFGYLK